ncbi:MAG: hypothetical protein V2A34_13140, partial [Lentisphaerota bacterium]
FITLKPVDGDEAPQRGNMRFIGEKPVELTISKMRPESCVARIFPSEGKKAIKAGDYIYAK